MILTLLLACPAEPADVSSIFEIEDTAATPQTGDIIWSINETVGAIIAVSWVQGTPATTWVAF